MAYKITADWDREVNKCIKIGLRNGNQAVRPASQMCKGGPPGGQQRFGPDMQMASFLSEPYPPNVGYYS